MTTEEAISLVRKAFDTWENWESDVNGGDDWSEEHKARDMAIDALEQEPFKGAYIQVVKERDIAIEQLRELGYSLGEKIRPYEKEQEPIIGEVRAEIIEEMLYHSGTGEEVIQAYADGLHKAIELIDKYKAGNEVEE